MSCTDKSWKLIFKGEDGNMHVMPMNDLRDHIESFWCLCDPVMDTEHSDVIIHNAFDGREADEENAEKHH